ncbi:uncharacterized protein LOC115672246 [Syzygium oleosum]|uniref:uncharacterized protein LOC115672246 n=1 Tax=Syzygium oleosum TaxID=219896 RepID=UPI0024BBB1A9|nr:uncharacterized protein LOC115672246 [Syzygium oleosum]
MLASHIERVEQTGRCPRVSSEDILDEELTELNWEFAQSSESDDEVLGNENFLSDDDDDEELAESRQKQRDFLRNKFASLRELHEPQPVNSHQEAPADGNQTEYEQSGGEDESASSENELEDDEVPVRRRKSKNEIDNAKLFKEAIVKYSIAEQMSVEFIRNTKEFVRAKCSQPNCSWKIYGALNRKSGSFQIRSLQEEHTCSIIFDNKRVTSVWLSKHFFNTIKAMPEIKSPQLKQLVKEQVGVNVSRNQCKRAKQKVMSTLMGQYKEEYGQVWDYACECMLQNPSSRVYVEVIERPLPDCGTKFNRFYVCFDACKRGFLVGCRKIVGLDGCFLKGLCKGELLAVVGRDANNQMFPIAWAIVKVETKDTWSWFLKNIMADLEITNGEAKLMPYAEHRMCARHIYANWAKNYKGDKLQKQFWHIAKSTNMADFRIAKQELFQLLNEGFEALFKTEPKHWCRAFFSEEFKCDIIDNNLSEAFNGRVL